MACCCPVLLHDCFSLPAVPSGVACCCRVLLHDCFFSSCGTDPCPGTASNVPLHDSVVIVFSGPGSHCETGPATPTQEWVYEVFQRLQRLTILLSHYPYCRLLPLPHPAQAFRNHLCCKVYGPARSPYGFRETMCARVHNSMMTIYLILYCSAACPDTRTYA